MSRTGCRGTATGLHSVRGRSGLDGRPVNLCDRPERLKVRARRDTDVERCLPFPPPLDDCQEQVCVGSGGVCSRVRRIFLMFHNPLVKTARFRWFRATTRPRPTRRPRARRARHARAFAYLEGMWVMSPRAGAPAPPRPTAFQERRAFLWKGFGLNGAVLVQVHEQNTDKSGQSPRGLGDAFQDAGIGEHEQPNPYPGCCHEDGPFLSTSPSIFPAVQPMLHSLPLTRSTI